MQWNPLLTWALPAATALIQLYATARLLGLEKRIREWVHEEYEPRELASVKHEAIDQRVTHLEHAKWRA
jgi:hypothetical protein